MSSKTKTNFKEVCNFVDTCIAIDEMMKKVNNHYMEVGYPVINGFETCFSNIHDIDILSKSTIDAYKTSKEYKNLIESIETLEVELFMHHLLEDAKTGTMPFNCPSLTTEKAAKSFICNCIAIGEGINIDYKSIDVTKKLYSICEQDLQIYLPYFSPMLYIMDRYKDRYEAKMKENSKKQKTKRKNQKANS